MSILYGGVAMNCHKVQSLMSAYVDCELSGLEMLVVRQHLSGCGECNSEFESLLGVKKALGNLCAKHPASDLAGRICLRLDQVSAPKGNRIPGALQERLTIFPAGLRWAAAGVGVFTLLLMLRAGQMSTNPPMFMHPPSYGQTSGIASQGSVRLTPGVSAAGFVLFGAAPPTTSARQPWGLPKEPESIFGGTDLVLTSYPR